MRLYTRTKRRLAANRLAGTMTNKYQRKQATRTAGQLGNGLSIIDGQLYNTGATNGHGTVAVVNLGRPAAAIYAPQTGGQITLGGGNGGGCSDGGSGGVGIHALDGAYHTGTLAQSQAPWAALDSDLQAHIGDDNIHHDRLHSIISTDDHEVTAARYTVLGTPSAANTLAMWATSSNGTAGNALLRSDSNGAIYLNDLYAYDKVQSQSFTPGFGGSGYRLDYAVTNAGKSFLEVDDLSVRRRMTVRELLIRKIRTTNGDIFVTSGGEVESATDLGGGAWRLTFKEDHGFLEDDLIAAQAWTGSGAFRLEATVTAAPSTKQLDISLDDGGGDTPGTVLAAGLALSFARHGSTSDADRQGVVYLSSDDTGAPFIRVLDGIDSWAAWTDPASLKVQMGRLDGISHAVLGDLAGYGLFGEAVYLTGTMTAGNGDAVLGDQGLNIQAGTISSGGWTNSTDKITFSTDPMATPDAENTVGQIGAVQFVSGSDVVRSLAAHAQAGTAEGADEAIIELSTQYVDPEALVPIQSAGITMGANNGSPYITIRLQGDSAAAGNVYVASPVTDFSGHIRMSGGGDIGTALAPVGTLYADEMVILGEVNYDNPGMVNDTRYMPRTELTTTLAAYALDSHEHAGLVTTADLATELADYATTAYVDSEIAAIPAPDLSNYWTKAQADGRYNTLIAYNAHVAAANPHGTALADLSAKDYGNLDNRGHLLADATGLGPDHSISGATEGHVLRATGATAARFMQLGALDLGITAAQYSVLGTPNAANTLAAWATSDDGTGGNVLLRTDTDGDITITDLHTAAIYASGLADFNGDVEIGDASTGWEFDVTAGQLRSRNYYPANPDRGILLDAADGRIEAMDISARSGRLRAAVFELDSTVVGPASEIWTRKGGAVTQASIEIDSSGSITVPVRDRSLGHFPQFEAGETIRLRGYASTALTQDTEAPTWQPDFLIMFGPAMDRSRLILCDVYLIISTVASEDGYFRYICTWAHGDDRIIFPPDTPVIGYGNADNDNPLGAMKIDADADGPRITAFRYGEDAWIETPIYAAGDISSITGNAGEVGTLAGTDLTDSAAALFAGTNQRILLRNGDLLVTDSGGVTRFSITGDDGMQIRTGDDDKSWIDFLDAEGATYARIGTDAVAYGTVSERPPGGGDWYEPDTTDLRFGSPGLVWEAFFQNPDNLILPDSRVADIEQWDDMAAKLHWRVNDSAGDPKGWITLAATVEDEIFGTLESSYMDLSAVAIYLNTKNAVFLGDAQIDGELTANRMALSDLTRWFSPPAAADVESGYLYVDSNGFVKVK